MIIGSNILYRENLPSTNSYASTLLSGSTPIEGTVIRTNWQSAGRGYADNKWESEKNKNLLISIILFPATIIPEEVFLLSMAVSLGICDFLNIYLSRISIKWPNDIYVKDDKIAGILIENSILPGSVEHSIVGIGININQANFKSDAPNPVSLSNLTGESYDLESCLKQLLGCLDKRYKLLIAGNFAKIRNDYSSGLYRKDQWSRFSDSEGLFTGRIIEVTGAGKLKIENKDGSVREYSFKEVEFIL